MLPGQLSPVSRQVNKQTPKRTIWFRERPSRLVDAGLHCKPAGDDSVADSKDENTPAFEGIVDPE
jgi:hypothetical protein